MKIVCYTPKMEYTESSIAALISHIHTLTADFTNKRLSQKGNFVSSHGFILYQLALEGRLTKGQLAERINRDKSTTTILTRKLLNEGLIKEDVSETDSRVKYLSLSTKGKKYNALTKEISRDLLDICYAGFSQEEKETLLLLLKKMNANIENNLQ